MNKPGPKPKIDADAKRQIYAILSVGASLRDAAGYLGVDWKTIINAKKADPEFCTGCMKAANQGKIKMLKKIGKARQWQAAAWMLERKWGKEFGRKDRQQVEVSGKLDHGHSVADDDLRRILSDTRSADLANALARRLAVKPGGVSQSSN